MDIGVNCRHMYKFISWNVNGLRAVAGKGFADIFEDLDADFFCLQETGTSRTRRDIPARQYIPGTHL